MQIVKNKQEQSIVVLSDIIFTNKQNINWDEVEKYLERHI